MLEVEEQLLQDDDERRSRAAVRPAQRTLEGLGHSRRHAGSRHPEAKRLGGLQAALDRRNRRRLLHPSATVSSASDRT